MTTTFLSGLANSAFRLGFLVAAAVDDQTFDLAGLGPMGQADWDHTSRHKQVAAPAP